MFVSAYITGNFRAVNYHFPKSLTGSEGHLLST
jgi:hypothetical protein